MTAASTRPVPPPPPTIPPPPDPVPTTPSATWLHLALIVAGAFMMNLALQSRMASVAGLLAVVFAGFVVVASPQRRTVGALGAVALALLLASNLVLRVSNWVIAPTVIATSTLLFIACFDQLASARLGVVRDAGRAMVGGVTGSVRHLLSPVSRWLGPASERRAAVLRGGAIAAGVCFILTLLLANADAVIGEVVGGSLQSSTWGHLALTAVLTLAFAAGSVISHDDVVDSGASFAPTERPIEALMGLSAIAVVLGSWVAVQATIATGGAQRLLATASVTRAEHAREGFFELVIVVAVVLCLVTVFGQLLGQHKQAGALALLGTVGILSTVLVAITFSRLALYIDAFGLTMLRLSVAWFLGWLAFLIAAVTAWAAGLRPNQPWLTTLTLASAAIVVSAFGWSNPEATVASTNLSRDNAVVELDISYLESLGPDATPTVAANGITAGFDCRDHPPAYGPFSWNRSLDRAC